MAFREDNCGSVMDSKVINSPYCGNAERRARPGNSTKGIVEMIRLPVLSGMNVDSLRSCDQIVGQEQRVEEPQYTGMFYHNIEYPAFCQYGVGSGCFSPLECVAAFACFVLPFLPSHSFNSG